MSGVIRRSIGKIYTGVFRRTSTFVVTIVAGAFLFERAFDQGADYVWEYLNRGKLYKDTKEFFPKEGEEDS